MDILNQENISDAFHLLKALFDNAVDGIILINEKGIVVSVNPAASRLFHYEQNEIIGNNIKMLMPEPDHSGHDDYLSNYKQTKVRKIIDIGREVKGKRKDGTIFPFYLSISEVENSGEKLFAGVIHDISETKQAIKELETSKKRWEAIIHTAVDTIIIIDSRGIIEDVNTATSKLFKYRRNEMIGNNINMLMPEPDHSAHDQYLSNYHESHQPKIIGTGRDVKGKKKDGTIFPLRLAVSEFVVDENKFFAGIIHDLTEQKNAEKKINALNSQLEQKVRERTEELAEVVNKLLSTNGLLKVEVAERKIIQDELKRNQKELEKLLEKEKELGELKSRFVSTASHEFRTPLSTILSSISLISRYVKESEQDKRNKHIDRIKSSVRHLSNILNDFLSLSKLEEGKISYRPTEIEWKPFIREVLDSIKVTLKPGQFISYHLQQPIEPLFADDKLLKNILFNLLSNASKYSKDGDEIILDVSKQEGTLLISVRDFGIGIPAEDQSRLFMRFHRAKNAANIKGTGLGLNIVRHYVKLMDGEITFESKEYHGTTFYIKIPIGK